MHKSKEIYKSGEVKYINPVFLQDASNTLHNPYSLNTMTGFS